MSSLPPLTPEQLVKPPHFEARMSFAFGALFLAPGVHVPYFPVWLAAHGFSPNDIAIILSAPMFLRVFTTPLITTLADRSGDRANVLTFLVAASAFLSLGYFLPVSYAMALIVSLLLAIFWTPHSPIANSVALSGVRRWGCSYTKMRIWGSISYLTGSLVGGLVLSFTGIDIVPILITGGLALLLAASLLVPRVGPPRRASQPALDALGKADRFDKRFLYMVIGAGLIAGSHSFINSFMSIYWQSVGYSDPMIGFFWSFSVAVEVLMFWAFPRFLGRLSATDILLTAALFSVLRWIAYPMVEPLGLAAPGFFAVQGLHAFSTGLMIIGVQKVIADEVPEARTGAAQGLAYFANGLSIAAITLASGPLYSALGIYGTIPMIGVAAIATGSILLARHQPQRSAVGGETSEPA